MGPGNKERDTRRRDIVFTCTKEEAQIARRILEETRKFGGQIDHLKIKVVTNIPYRTSLLDPHIEGLVDLRQFARASVLVAHGVDPEDVWVRPQLDKAKKEAFNNRGGDFSFVIWKDSYGQVIAQGEMSYFIDSPLVKKLMALGPTNRGWLEVLCWDLGMPERWVDESHELFKWVDKKTATFLFSDEIRTLKSQGRLLAYACHDLYEEAFEAYLIDKHPKYSWPTLFKVIGHLFD